MRMTPNWPYKVEVCWCWNRGTLGILGAKNDRENGGFGQTEKNPLSRPLTKTSNSPASDARMFSMAKVATSTLASRAACPGSGGEAMTSTRRMCSSKRRSNASMNPRTAGSLRRAYSLMNWWEVQISNLLGLTTELRTMDLVHPSLMKISLKILLSKRDEKSSWSMSMVDRERQMLVWGRRVVWGVRVAHWHLSSRCARKKVLIWHTDNKVLMWDTTYNKITERIGKGKAHNKITERIAKVMK